MPFTLLAIVLVLLVAAFESYQFLQGSSKFARPSKQSASSSSSAASASSPKKATSNEEEEHQQKPKPPAKKHQQQKPKQPAPVAKNKNNKQLFTCPAELRTSDNLFYDEGYFRPKSQEKAAHLKEYLDNYRTEEFDDWGKTYEEVKEQMYPWKKKHFAGLRDGDSIYESACGLGLNLLMTLEIVYETTGVENIVVYGNDYIEESVDIARVVAGEGYLPGKGKLGSLCPADSTNLSFVPSDSFDLVYSGYITALYDPLGWNLTETETYKRLSWLCDSDDRKSQKLARLAQRRQNIWFQSWISEMVRIAKPGAPVIVEQVQPPYCQERSDYGGVSRDRYWTPGAIKVHGWDVDPTSVDTMSDTIFEYSSRYHVFMRKNGGQ